MNVSSGEIYWSEETYKIFEYERAVKPTLELIFQRIHPDDRDLVQQTIDRTTNERTNFDIEHRLLMPDGSVKYLHVLAHALEPSSGDLELVGAVTDVTAAKQAEETLRQSEAYLVEAQRLSHTGSGPGTSAPRGSSGRSKLFKFLASIQILQRQPERGSWQGYIRTTEPVSNGSKLSFTRGTTPNATTASFFQTVQ